MSNEQPFYTIVGQGLAGTILSMRMEERGIPHQVIDDPSVSQSSRIAAGLANPILLKRLKWVRHAEHFWPEAQPFYLSWERKLQAPFTHPVKMWHLFRSVGEINRWQEKAENPLFSPFLGSVLPPSPHERLEAPHGIGVLEELFWLDTALFLKAYRSYLQEKGAYHAVPAQEVLEKHIWPVRPPEAPLVLCNGHLARQTHPTLAKAFTPTRGEVLLLEAPAMPADIALHARIFALPLGRKRFKLGASYAHDDLRDSPSAAGREWLLNQWENMYNGPYEVTDHLAGVRPNVADRQPLLGKWQPRKYLFNGLGSRGVLMGPLLAGHLLAHLEDGAPLAAEWDIDRFISN